MHTHTEVSEEFARLPQRSFRDLSLLIKLGPFPSYLARGWGNGMREQQLPEDQPPPRPH